MRVHQCGIKALKLHNEGKISEAMQALNDMETASDEVMQCLSRLAVNIKR